MKNNWLKIINFDDSFNYSYDNLAIVLDFFFRDFIFVRYDKDNIVVRNIYSNKEFLVKRNNDLRINVSFKDADGKRIINRNLKLYRYNYKDILFNHMGLQLFYKDSDKLILDKTTINLTKNRMCLWDLQVTTLDKIKINSSLSVQSDLFINYDINAKYGYPDLSFGLNIFRNNKDTIKSEGYYNDGMACFDGYKVINNTIPITELAFSGMNNLYEHKKYLLEKKSVNKTNKIGFV